MRIHELKKKKDLLNKKEKEISFELASFICKFHGKDIDPSTATFTLENVVENELTTKRTRRRGQLSVDTNEKTKCYVLSFDGIKSPLYSDSFVEDFYGFLTNKEENPREIYFSELKRLKNNITTFYDKKD